MLRAAIIEKSKEKRELVRSSIVSLNMDILVKDFPCIYDFTEQLDDQATSFDLVFLNTTIHHEGDGIELASNIRNKNRQVLICFITDSTKYYAEAFEVFATGYLLYPFDVSRLYGIISFHTRKNETEKRASWMIKETGGNYRRIYCRNIVYIESFNREIIIHMEDGSTILSYCKLNDAVEELSKTLFLRCHQSYCVSLFFVESMQRECFKMPGGVEIPISRKYQKIAKEVYYDYMFDRM